MVIIYMYKQRFNSRFSRRNQRRNTNGSSINISKFINKGTTPYTEKVEKIDHSFSDFNLDERLIRSVSKKGYVIPTPIQDKAIPVITQKQDFLGIANTGTGKTGAFLIPLIDRVIKNQTETVLIVAPTRELALQIDHEFQSLTATLGIWSVLCIGGLSMYQQRNRLQRKYNFIIGTPGRIKDLITQKALNISKISVVVLDEVDRMLDMGFIPDMRAILHQTPTSRQSLFFSATVSSQVSTLIREFSRDLKSVSVKSTETAANIEQDVVRYRNQENKIEVLHHLLVQDDFDKVLIFGRTKWGVQKLSQKLNDRGFRSDSIHGNKSQPQRQRTLLNFRQNRIKILVATDVAARGLDISGVTHVINYDLPENYDDYIHRIGRTGRAHKTGKALTFVS